MSFCNLPSPPEFPWQPNATVTKLSGFRSPRLADRQVLKKLKTRRWFKTRPTLTQSDDFHYQVVFDNECASLGARNYFARERVRTPLSEARRIRKLDEKTWSHGIPHNWAALRH